MNNRRNQKTPVFFRILLLTLLLAAAAVFGGCGQNDEQQMPETVKIGFIGPLTGANASEGLAALDAFNMYIETAAARNLPYKIEVVAYDDASIPETGAEAAKNLADDPQVLAVAGHWNSPVAEATIPIFIGAKCPMVIWGAISESLTCELNYPYITRVVPTDAQENQPLVDYILGDFGYGKIFVITPDSSYGNSNTAAFKRQMANYPAKLTGFMRVSPNLTDYSAILAEARAAGSDAIYYGGTASDCALIAKQMQTMGMDDILLFGVSGIASEEFLKVAGKAAAEGTVSIYPGIDAETSPEYAKFLTEYQKYSDNKIGAFTIYAYQTAQVIIAALGDIEGAPDRAKVTDAIADVETDGIMGHIAFDAIGQTTNPMCYLAVCQDGKWTAYAGSEYATGLRTLPGQKH